MSSPAPAPFARLPVLVLPAGHKVALDHQAGVFAGTNDLLERIGGRPPLSLEAFIERHRKAFE